MLNAAEASNPKDQPRQDAEEPETKRDPSAEFIQDLAQSGTANELSTVKAASDAVEGEADQAKPQARRHPERKE